MKWFGYCMRPEENYQRLFLPNRINQADFR
jgi:hypothetical protein